MTSRDMFVVAEEMEKLLRERSKLHDDLMQSNQQLQESRQQVPFGFRLSARERKRERESTHFHGGMAVGGPHVSKSQLDPLRQELQAQVRWSCVELVLLVC